MNMHKTLSAEILCIGTEILIGDIVNTNAAYISGRLAAMGISQYHQAVVGDNPERLEECIHTALSRCDLLIVAGTSLTVEPAASMLEYFRGGSREMVVINPEATAADERATLVIREGAEKALGSLRVT